MARNLASDKKHLEQRVFSRQKKALRLLEDLHELLNSPKHDRYYHLLEIICEGIITPYTTWTADFKGYGEHVCRLLQQGKRISPQMIATIRRMADLPAEPIRFLIAETETKVKKGNYDPFLSPGAQSKYSFYELDLVNSKEFQADLAEFCREWDLTKEYDEYRIVRRTQMCERNFRPKDWVFTGKGKKELFQYALDVFCGTWELYGLEEKEGRPFPLLQKLSINATANGLMIFIPAYWSFDFKRDLNWPEFNKLQKARCSGRVGAKSATARMEYNAHLRRILAAKEEAKHLKLKGKEFYLHLRKTVKITTDTDDRTIRRWCDQADQLL
ncbi:MAG: hypothetical protein JWM68_1973 [Verrucomicrobiales bacterium]|nr:hypothetical protein [Verrucomicrobiales bacterium]